MPELEKFLKSRLSGARMVAVLGIGSDLRADDAAGMLAAEDLERRRKKAGKRRALKVFFGGTAPENITGEIKKLKPSHLVIIDTAEMGEKAGTILVLDPANMGGGVTFSTHKMPAKVLIDYFNKSFKCDILTIGIQPSSIEFTKPVSKDVKESARDIAKAIWNSIK